MAAAAPTLIAINHDDYHARDIGLTADGRQYFLTNPFVAADGDDPGGEFVALYTFDAEGRLLNAEIDDLGTRAKLDEDWLAWILEQRLLSLGARTPGRIRVRPFAIERFGVTFGLVPRPPESGDEDWIVTVEPGDYMAFFPPYDGEYDT